MGKKKRPKIQSVSHNLWKADGRTYGHKTGRKLGMIWSSDKSGETTNVLLGCSNRSMASWGGEMVIAVEASPHAIRGKWQTQVQITSCVCGISIPSDEN